MLFNITEAVKDQFTPGFIAKTSTYLGESEMGITKALAGSLPAVLGTMAGKASAGSTGADEVFSISKKSYDADITGRIDFFFTDGAVMLNEGLNLAYGLMGDKIPALINVISNFSGIRKSSVGSLLCMVAPLSAAVAGKHAADNNLSAADLASLFSNQKPEIINAIPIRLDGIISILELTKPVEIFHSFSPLVKEEEEAVVYKQEENKTEKKFSWLAWLFVPIATAGLTWWLGIAGCNSPANTTTIAKKSTTTEMQHRN